jgi:hypothetical protein
MKSVTALGTWRRTPGMGKSENKGFEQNPKGSQWEAGSVAGAAGLIREDLVSPSKWEWSGPSLQKWGCKQWSVALASPV